MSGKNRFSEREVAIYLLNRLRFHDNAQKSALKSNSIKGQPAGETGGRAEADKPEPTEAVRILAGISELSIERQDLIRQIILDERLLNEQGESVTPIDMPGVLSRLFDTETADLRCYAADMDTNQAILDSAAEAKERLAAINKEIIELLSDPRIEDLYLKKTEETVRSIRIARNVDALQKLAEKSELAGMRLIAQRNSDDLSISSADLAVMKKYSKNIEEINNKIKDLTGPENAYYELKRRGLLEYRRQLMKGGFVKTASIRNEIMRVLSHLQLGIPVFLRGHLGVGKTELALHVCREYLKAEPEFISGSEESTKYDIYGKTQIGAASEHERLQEFKKRIADYRLMNPGATEKDVVDAEKRYYEAIIVRAQAGSFFQYGPLLRAMKEGKPLIIDEMDGIPHSILMRINHALTRKPGDRGRIQEAGGEEITVRQGFCVLATGNVKSARYKREDLDAAFLSRWWSEDIKYPPQEEMYEILTAALIDRRGNLQLRNADDMEDVRRLTEAAAEIQRIFTGDYLDYLGEGADAARGIAAGLNKSVLSLRHLWNIIRPWKANNYKEPIEYYILNEFIRSAVAEDQVYLVQLFCRFRFFKSWTLKELDMPGLTETKLMAFQGRQV